MEISKTYLCLNEQNVYIINHYKLGTRFVNFWFNKNHQDQIPNIIEHNLEKGLSYLTPDGHWNNIIERKPINKNILLLYRNPINKTISGLIEDFHEAILRGQNPDEYDEVLNSISNNTYKKLLTRLTDKKEWRVKEFAKVFDSEFIYDTDIRTDDVYTDLFISYVKMRKRNNTIDDRHSKYHTGSFYFLINEYLRDVQNFKIFDLDNEDLNLANVLKQYQKSRHINSEKKDDWSNLNYKSLITNEFWNSSIFIKIKKDLEDEILFYNALKANKNNIRNTDEEM